MDSVRIPAYVDELPQVWFWEIDEAIFIMLGLSVGLLINWMFWGTVTGLAIASVFGRFKQGQNRGLLLHMAYWYGVLPFQNMWCDISFKRDWTY
jgi:conjugal transfer pilus assembly protein TraL